MPNLYSGPNRIRETLLKKPSIEEKEVLDLRIWKESPEESPDSDSVFNIINKFTDMPSFLESLEPYGEQLRAARDVLELGGGQGWASCLLKRLHPRLRVTVTDISEHAVASLHKWERILSVKTENAFACRSYDIPAGDSSYDIVFTYAAAHHFEAHRRTLRELARVLRPGGSAFYLHEPCCRRWIYPLAYRRVNAKRPEVPEDVLVYPEILKLAREAGLRPEFRFTPTLHKRGPREHLYYSALRAVPVLQSLLPCTGTFRFVKPQA